MSEKPDETLDILRYELEEYRAIVTETLNKALHEVAEVRLIAEAMKDVISSDIDVLKIDAERISRSVSDIELRLSSSEVRVGELEGAIAGQIAAESEQLTEFLFQEFRSIRDEVSDLRSLSEQVINSAQYISDLMEMVTGSTINLYASLDFERSRSSGGEGADTGGQRAGADDASANLDRRLSQLERLTYENLKDLTRSETLAHEQLRRAIELSVYLGRNDPEQGVELYERTAKLAQLQGFEVLRDDPAIQASWFKRATLRATEALTSEQVQGRLAKVEEALELKHIEQVRAARDKDHSEALLNISKAMEGQDRAAVVVGALVVVKTPSPSGGSNMVARTLTTEQQRVLEDDPRLASDPEGLLALIFSRPHSQGPQPLLP